MVGLAAVSLAVVRRRRQGRHDAAIARLAIGGSRCSRSALGTCPPSQPVSSLPVFARPDLSLTPDDLWVDANGDVWVTVTSQGHILDFAASGALRQNFPDPNGPEGIIVTAAATLVADQTRVA